MGRIVPYIMKNIEKKMFEATNQTTWWLTYPSEKYEFISWDDYSQIFPIYGKS